MPHQICDRESKKKQQQYDMGIKYHESTCKEKIKKIQQFFQSLKNNNKNTCFLRYFNLSRTDLKSYKLFSFQQILYEIQQWSIQSFRIRQISNLNIFKPFCGIRLQSLKQINLLNCQVNNFQPISWVDAPNLQKIYLIGNKLTNLKSFHKTYFTKLQQISFQSNHTFTCDNFIHFIRMFQTNLKNHHQTPVFQIQLQGPSHTSEKQEKQTQLPFSQKWKKQKSIKFSEKLEEYQFCNIQFDQIAEHQMYLYLILKSKGFQSLTIENLQQILIKMSPVI